MSGPFVSIPCPNCGHRIDSAGVCAECGLDATLLFAIRRSAETLARQSAQRAGEGRWQEAYDVAAESLRLMANGNDLAAFVLLASSLAGARGAVRRIARPDPHRLPVELRGPLKELLATEEEIRSLLQTEDSDEAARRVRELEERHSGLGLFSKAEALAAVSAVAAPPAQRDAQLSRRIFAAAVVATLLFMLLGGWIAADLFDHRGRQERA